MLHCTKFCGHGLDSDGITLTLRSCNIKAPVKRKSVMLLSHRSIGYCLKCDRCKMLPVKFRALQVTKVLSTAESNRMYHNTSLERTFGKVLDKKAIKTGYLFYLLYIIGNQIYNLTCVCRTQGRLAHPQSLKNNKG